MDAYDGLSNGLAEAYSQAVLLHEILSAAILLPYGLYLAALFNYKSFLQLSRWVFLIFPLAFLFLSSSLVTGVFILALRGFSLDLRVASMIVVLGLFLAGEIYRAKRAKKARTSKEGMVSYARFCKLLYGIFFVTQSSFLAFYSLF